MIAALLSWALAAGAAPAADQLARLHGHTVTVAADRQSFTIDRVAGEGKPFVGVVERRGRQLHLVVDRGVALRLEGPLARPRIAGPGYRVWVLGERDGRALHARRLGVLRPPE